MKKLIFPLLAISSMALAQSEEPSLELAARDREYRMQNNMHSKKSAKDPMTSKECRSYVYPLTWDKGNVFIEADYIYWKPVAKIPYAVTSDLVNYLDTAGTAFQVSINRTINQVNLGAKSGFKVALGAYLPPYGWTTSGEYTYLKRTSSGSTVGTTDSSVTNANATKNIDAIWRTLGLSLGNTPDRLTSAAASQKLSYQTFDWVMQKTVFWKSMFAFSPYFGVRGVWITNKLDVTYDGIGADTNQVAFNVQDIARVQSDYRGGGLRAGFKGNWMLGYGLEIFGNASMSLVYGKHFIRQKEDILALTAVTPAFLNASTTSANDWKALRSAFQLALGLEWGRNFNNDSFFFGLNIAYEANLWPDVIQLRKLQRQRGVTTGATVLTAPINEPLQDLNRTLGLHGLTIGAKFDF